MFTTLTIKFGGRNRPYQLQRRAHPDKQEPSCLVARVNAALRKEQFTAIFRAKSDVFPNELALKVAYGRPKSTPVKGLRREYIVYETKLKALQGDVVPRCHGLFEGRTTSGFFISCLVLDYVGEPSFLYVEELNMDLRLDILRSLLAIHKAGITHGPGFIDEEDIIFDEQQKPWIIDFQSARPHAICRHAQIDEGVLVPSLSDFGCGEIWDFCSGAEIWRSRNIHFFGVSLEERCITSMQYLMEAIRIFPCYFDDKPRNKVLKGAEDIWAAVQAYKANGNVRPRRYEHFTGVSLYCVAEHQAARKRSWEKEMEGRDVDYDSASDDDDWDDGSTNEEDFDDENDEGDEGVDEWDVLE